MDHQGIDEHLIYKTLVLTGNVTGPVVGVVPIDRHLDEKALARVSGNKKSRHGATQRPRENDWLRPRCQHPGGHL